MATDLQAAASTAIPKHEAFVEKQLGLARRRIRLLDLAAAGLGFTILTLGYALAMILLDRAVQLPAGARQVAFGGYVLAALAYLGWAVVLPLLRQVNPYFAARELERTLPSAKNSLVNWLDLRRQVLSPAVQTALGQRAARDLTQANLDEAVKPKQVAWLGGATGGLVLGLLILFFLGPTQFLSLISRAFAPFTNTLLANRTQLTLLKPESGDTVVPMGRAFSCSVEVGGRVPNSSQPDALRLHYRHNQNDAYEEKPLEQGEAARVWGTTIPAALVQNGFWYKITGGDASTPEYRVQVRAVPLITGHEVTYRFRPYLGWPEQTSRNANLTAHRGTHVTLIARTNRQVKEGQLVVEGEKPLVAAMVPDDPNAMRFELDLLRSGKYRIWFTSTENEKNTDPLPFEIKVLEDLKPTVELTKPGSDLELPANGTLRLEGVARDDFGVAGLTLHLALVEGPALKSRPYREGKGFRLADGSYPQVLEYKDFVELDKVRTAQGQVLQLQPGQVLKYWLEAADGCDMPGPNVARTPDYLVTIADPEKDQDQIKQERQAAEQEQKQHERQQDQQLNKDNATRAARPQQPQQPPKDQPPPKPEEQQPGGQEPQPQKDEALQNKLNRLKDEVEKQQREAGNQPGQPKEPPQQPEKGEPKNEGNTPQPDQQPEKGENKQPGQPDQKQPQGQGKNEGKPDSQQQQQGEPKGQGQPQGQPDQSQGKQPQQGTAKGEPQQTPQGDSKGNPQQATGAEQQGQPKSGEGTQTAASQPKPESGDPMNTGAQQGEPKGDGKPQPGATAQGQPQKRSPEEAARELAKQLFSDNPKQREAAAEKIAEMQRLAQRDAQSNDPRQQADAERKTQEAARAAEEFAKAAGGKDEKAKQAAADALKKAMDKVEREEQRTRAGEKQQIDDLAKKMQGGDPQGRADARKQMEQLAQQAGSRENRQAAQDALNKQEQNAGASGGDPQTKKEIEKLAQQLRSGSEQARGAAEKKLEQLAREGKDPQTRQQAKEALEKNRQSAGGGDPKMKEQIDKLAKDLQSGDKQTRDAAQKQLKQMAEKGGDPQTRQAAKEALQKNDSTAQGGAGDPKMKEQIDKLAKDLQSGDQQTREAAQKQLEQLARDGKDEQTRKQAQDALAKHGQGQAAEQRAEQVRNALEQMAKQLQNMDAKQREELLKNMQDLAKKAQESGEKIDAEEMMRQAKEMTKAFEKLSPEAKRTLDELARQMQSQNDQQRKEAEQKLDEMRRNAQDEATRQAAEAMQKHAEKQRAEQDGSGRRNVTGPDENRRGGHDEPAQPAADPNKDHAARAGSLTLQSFQEFKKKLTKEMMNEHKITEQDLKEMEELIRRRQADKPDPEKLVTPQRVGALPNQGVRKVESGAQNPGNAQRTGPTQAPQDVRDAQYEFSKILSERQKARGKQ